MEQLNIDEDLPRKREVLRREVCLLNYLSMKCVALDSNVLSKLLNTFEPNFAHLRIHSYTTLVV